MSVSMKIIGLALAVAVSTSATSAYAAPIYDTFGPLSGATFGGQGIPNDEVAVSSQFVDGNVIITVAMSATQRYSNPALTDDGAGTYFATTGSNFGGAGQSSVLGLKWNFNYYLQVEGINGATPKLTDYQIDAFYDFDPSFDTPIGLLGRLDVTAILNLSSDPNSTFEEGSQNLLFGFLATDVPPLLDAPAGTIDANAVGEYNFGIQVSRAGWGIETVAMDVQVVPEPTSLALLTLGGVVILSRRKR